MSLADFRDIAVIALAVFFTVQTMVIIILVSFLIKLALEIRGKADAILTSTQATVQNINGTASFVGDKVASPIIKGISFATGVKRTVGTLAGLTRKNGR